MPILSGEFQVKAGDYTLDVLLNLYALNLYLEEEEMALAELDKELVKRPLHALPRLVWAGVRTAALRSDAELPMTFDKFAVLFGSEDWEPISKHVNTALALSTGKTKPRATKAAPKS